MPTQNKPSTLLTLDENELIFSLLGAKCCSLATSVVERYVSGGRTGKDEWCFSEVGVICLVKDNIRRSYFFRIYCPNKKQLLWEHELYNFMDYFKLDENLHAFEAEECIVGFNFANEDEGNVLHDIVKEKLENKKQRRLEKRSRSSNNMLANNHNNNNIVRTKPVVNDNQPMVHIPVQAKTQPINTGPTRTPHHTSYSGGKQKVKGKLSKDMIGVPQDFRHISHVGWDPDSGFNLDQVNDKHLEEFFIKAGVSESQLKDPDTRGFIYQFIEEHGGMEAVKTDLAPPVPARTKPHAPQVAPQVPPPPPTRTLPPRGPPPSHSTPTPPPPPPPPSSIPPPPPPISNIPPPPPPTSAPPPPQPQVDTRSALMEAIRSGTNLKPVSASSNGPPKPPPPVDGGRGELMEQIRHGITLNPVPKDETVSSKKNSQVEGGLATALADALAKRALVIQSDTSSSEDSDNEWDDE